MDMLTKQPLISIIIPAYNAESFISDAIRSVLAQDEQRYEILVIDDGSTDKTIEVVHAITDQRLRLLQQSSNQGASAARNRGLKEARGEYLAFLDADDSWSPYFLSTMLAAIQQPLAMVYCDDYRTSFAETIHWQAPEPLPIIEKTMADIFAHPYMATGALLFRRDVLAKVMGFNTELQTAEDIDFVLRIAEHYRIGYLPQALMQVRVRSGSLGNHAGAYRDNLDVIQSFFQRHPDFQQRESVRVQRLLEDIYYCYLRQLVVDRNLAEFRSVLQQMPWNTLSLRSLRLCVKALVLKLLQQGKV